MACRGSGVRVSGSILKHSPETGFGGHLPLFCALLLPVSYLGSPMSAHFAHLVTGKICSPWLNSGLKGSDADKAPLWTRLGIDERHGGVRLTRWIAAGKQHKNPRQTVQLGSRNCSQGASSSVCQIRECMSEWGGVPRGRRSASAEAARFHSPSANRWRTRTAAGRPSSMTIDRRRQGTRHHHARSELAGEAVLKTLEKKPRPQSERI